MQIVCEIISLQKKIARSRDSQEEKSDHGVDLDTTMMVVVPHNDKLGSWLEMVYGLSLAIISIL